MVGARWGHACIHLHLAGVRDHYTRGVLLHGLGTVDNGPMALPFVLHGWLIFQGSDGGGYGYMYSDMATRGARKRT